jgi:hypothetical protein
MNETSGPRCEDAVEKAVDKAAHEIIHEIVTHFSEHATTINEIIVVPITLLMRIIRTHDAIQILLKEKHPSEAAVLALTQFELRLDLAYTAHDVKHAAAWLGYENLEWPLLSMKKKIDTLFSDTAERENLKKIFTYLSGIKHGNPVYSELGFPGRMSGLKMMISSGPILDEFQEQLSEGIHGYAVYQLAWSSQVINRFTAKYADVCMEVRRNVRDLATTLHPLELEFRDFLENVARHRPGHFGVNRFKRIEATDDI